VIPSLPKNLPSKEYVRPEIQKEIGFRIGEQVLGREEAIKYLLRSEFSKYSIDTLLGYEPRRSFIGILIDDSEWAESVLERKKELEEILK